jgi:extradiol dioxygenase family protein
MECQNVILTVSKKNEKYHSHTRQWADISSKIALRLAYQHTLSVVATPMSQPLFHLAFPVGDIPQTKAFYVAGLGCRAGRETPRSLILNFYQHQLVAHVTPEIHPQKGIYPRHFGLVFATESEWHELYRRAQGAPLILLPGRQSAFSQFPTRTSHVFLD